MKVSALCAIALVLTSCVSKEPDTDVSPVPDAAMTIVKAKEILPIGGTEIFWENNDAIALRCQYDNEKEPISCIYTTSLAAPKATAVFKNTSDTKYPTKTGDKYIAIYPASLDYIKWGIGSEVIVAPKPVQIVNKKKIDRSSSIMIATSKDSEFSFAHVVSYLKFTVSSKTSSFYKLNITSGDKSQYITSRIRVNFEDGFTYSLDVHDAAGGVNEQAKENVSIETYDHSFFSPGTYMVAINPDTYEKGFKITFENRAGSIAIYEHTGTYRLKPGDVIDIGEIGTLDFHVSPYFYPQTETGMILKQSASEIKNVLWDTTYNVTNGLDYYQMKVQTSADEKLDVYLLRTDLSKDLDIKVAVSSESTSSEWHTQTLTQMAANIDSVSEPVYAMINADFCDNRPPIRPRGPVHMDGEVCCATYSLDPEYTQQGLSYVGVTYDGIMSIGTRNEYEYDKSSLKECTGAGVILIQNSEIVAWGSSRDPRTGIGYTPENIVWMLAVDGRHKGTEGMTYLEMASIFSSLGCKAAVNMDGGGSTEMIVRNPKTDIIEICNWPSDPTNGDGGQERPRPNAWAIVKK